MHLKNLAAVLIMALLALFSAPSSVSAQGGPPGPPPISPNMVFYTEGNDTDIQLSSAGLVPGSSTNYMPEIWTSLGVRCRDSNNQNLPIAYQTIEFSASPSGYLVFSNTSTQTNNNGRARVSVKGNRTNNANLADNTSISITAKWKNVYGQTIATSTGSVILRRTAPSGSYVPWTSSPLYTSRPLITYEMNSYEIGKMSNYATNALMGWIIINRLEWQLNAQSYDYKLKSAYYPGSPDFASTSAIAPITTVFNLHKLDGDYYADMGQGAQNDVDNVMPLVWRHHLQSTASHEVGHAIGLGMGNTHSSETRYDSVMTPTGLRYNTYGTQYAGSGDWAIITSYY